MRHTACLFGLLLLVVTASHAESATDARAEAMSALADARYEEAAAIYRGLVADDPDDGESVYRLGIALMSLDELDDAARRFERAASLGYQPQGAGYRLARIRARQGDEAAALSQLEALAAGGFPSPQLIENEADFEALRSSPRYEAALAGIRGNRYPCRANEEYRQFDFWLGEWDVSAAGQPAGTNDVRLILGDCVVFENWQGASGLAGKSFNFYDAAEGHWRQIWVDDTGSVLDFTGGVEDGVMRYTATTRDHETGATTRHRLSFTPGPDGTVRQLWEQSNDDGATWQAVFDGRYVPRGGQRVSAVSQD
jgi:tetratricopeptide (TPR) repeat protein